MEWTRYRNDPLPLIEEAQRFILQRTDSFSKLIEGSWRVAICVFVATDRLQHPFADHLIPSHPAFGERSSGPVAEALRRTYRILDNQLGRLREEAGDAVTILVSDHGFAPKTMASDLDAAIHHVIAGRLFVPSLTSLFGIAPAPGAGGHASQLGVTDRTGLTELSGVLAAALRRGDVAGIVASEETRAGIAERLVASGCDLGEAADSGKYISLDANAALSEVMPGGRLDAGRVAAFVEDLERSRLAASASSVTLVGEPALLLCRDGNAEAAIRLEHVWHDLTRRHPFLTLCPCPMECFSEPGDPDLFSGICAPHSAFCHAHGGA
jgi:hypothetical protein